MGSSQINSYEQVICLYNSGCYLVFNPCGEDIPFRAYTPTTFERKFQETEPQKQVPSFRKYKSKTNHTINATRWFQNGDHPDDGPSNKEGKVVRYYRNPITDSSICTECGKPMHLHGWIDFSPLGCRVCPGDFITTNEQGHTYACKPELFLSLFSIEDDLDDIY